MGRDSGSVERELDASRNIHWLEAMLDDFTVWSGPRKKIGNKDVCGRDV